MLRVVVILAVASACCFAIGATMEQVAASTAPSSRALPGPSFPKLVRDPVWLGGIGVTAGGWVLEAVALRGGELLVVEPLLATTVLFALPLAAYWRRYRLTPMHWVAALATAGGIAGFLATAAPRGGTSQAPGLEWGLAFAVLCVTLGASAFAGSFIPSHAQAGLLGGATGLAFGMADGLTKSVVALLFRSPLTALTHWQLYGLGAAGLLGVVAAQAAFHIAPLRASYPAMSVVEPLAGAILGVLLLRERVRAGVWLVALEIVLVVVALVGVAVLAASAASIEGGQRA